jgi:hypothetical protein
MDFLRHHSGVQWVQRKQPPAAAIRQGQMHHWRTGGLDIPRQVASPQSLTPFLQTTSQYRFQGECFNRQTQPDRR